MRAISLLEPQASLVSIGAIRYIAPSWKPEYRGPLAIHASTKFCAGQRFVSTWPELTRPLAAMGIYPSADLARTLGHIVGIAELVDVVEAEKAPSEWRLPGRIANAFSFFMARGKYIWRLESARRVTPVPARGSNGFFFVPDSIAERPDLKAA
jgi:hypothetical protein